MRTFLLLVFCACVTLSVVAQTPIAQKTGYADWEYIFQQLPDYKRFTDEMTVYIAQFETQLKTMNQNLETKYKAYQANVATMNEVVRKSTETEITQLQENLQKFKEDAEVSVRAKQGNLMEPIFAKIGKAIEEVAKENGYDFILAPAIPQGGGDILLYSSDKYDISDLVLKKLGVTPKPITPPTAGK